MAEEYIETTAEDFEIFKAECRRWVEIYGLKGWQLYFLHEERDGKIGGCDASLNGKNANIILGKKCIQKFYSTEEIKRTAFHEVTELLMCPVDANARYRWAAECDIEEAIHSVIRTLENVLYPKYPEPR